MKLGEKVAFCLPTAGRKTQFFHPLFSQPGKHSLEIPCTRSLIKYAVLLCYLCVERPALGHVRDDEAAGDAAVAHEERPESKEGGMNE